MHSLLREDDNATTPLAPSPPPVCFVWFIRYDYIDIRHQHIVLGMS